MGDSEDPAEPAYRYRLSISLRRPGVFRFPEAVREFDLEGDHSVELVARNANALEDASKVHFDGFPFASEEDARAAGERLRLRLRVLNAVLDLGLNVPMGDTRTGGASSSVKESVTRDHDAVAVDNVLGIAVHPNDGRHFEYVLSADMSVRKPDATYLLEGLSQLWNLDLDLDPAAEDAVTILAAATGESSLRVRFLTTYLALERLVARDKRSVEARELLEQLQATVRDSSIDERERRSLEGVIGSLATESHPSALMRLVDRIKDPPVIRGRPLRDFLSECITARNKIAHRVLDEADLPLRELADGLREFTLALVWSTHGIPSVSIDVPGDQISFQPGDLSVRVL